MLTKCDVPFEEDSVLPAIRAINTNAQWPEELPRFWFAPARLAALSSPVWHWHAALRSHKQLAYRCPTRTHLTLPLCCVARTTPPQPHRRAPSHTRPTQVVAVPGRGVPV